MLDFCHFDSEGCMNGLCTRKLICRSDSLERTLDLNSRNENRMNEGGRAEMGGMGFIDRSCPAKFVLRTVCWNSSA